MSSVLSFCLFQAAKCPEMQSHMVEEIRSVIGTDNDVPITMQHVQELKYVERFIKEVMRVYSPVPFYERQLREPFKLGK